MELPDEVVKNVLLVKFKELVGDNYDLLKIHLKEESVFQLLNQINFSDDIIQRVELFKELKKDGFFGANTIESEQKLKQKPTCKCSSNLQSQLS